jgi:Protein of unknown function (DUF2490)
MRVCLLAVLFGLFVGAPAPVAAQAIADGRTWWNATVQERAGTSSPWRWSFDVQARTRDGVEALDQLVVRPAVGFDLTNRSSVWLGYAYAAGFPPSGDVLHEHRAWQQYSWNRPVAGSQMTLRTRLEERAIEGDSGLAWRLRQQVRWSRPLPVARFSAIAWDEVFMHLNSTARTSSGPDQNRFFGGLGISLNPTARVEVGYLHQYANSLSGANRSNHVLSAVLNVVH